MPSTIGEDGDPLDVLVLTHEPTFVGCFILAKLLGVTEANQTSDGKTNRNDRFIAVPVEVKSQKPPARSIHNLDPILVEKISKFFIAYNELQGKKFKVLRFAGPERAMELIRDGFANTANTRTDEKKARNAIA